MDELGRTQDDLARAVGMSRFTINELIGEKRGLSPRLALLLAAAFDTEPGHFMAMQTAVEMFDAAHAYAAEIGKVVPLSAR